MIRTAIAIALTFGVVALAACPPPANGEGEGEGDPADAGCPDGTIPDAPGSSTCVAPELAGDPCGTAAASPCADGLRCTALDVCEPVDAPRADGDECASNADCASDQCEAPSGSDVCVESTCEIDEDCGAGTVCRHDDCVQACTAPAALGELCEWPSTDHCTGDGAVPCAPGLVCAGRDPAGTVCQAVSGPGGDCDPFHHPEGCDDGLECRVDLDLCVGPGDVDAPCDGSFDPAHDGCRDGLECLFTASTTTGGAGRCVTPGGRGAPCSSEWNRLEDGCSSTFLCNFDDTCQ